MSGPWFCIKTQPPNDMKELCWILFVRQLIGYFHTFCGVSIEAHIVFFFIVWLKNNVRVFFICSRRQSMLVPGVQQVALNALSKQYETESKGLKSRWIDCLHWHMNFLSVIPFKLRYISWPRWMRWMHWIQWIMNFINSQYGISILTNVLSWNGTEWRRDSTVPLYVDYRYKKFEKLDELYAAASASPRALIGERRLDSKSLFICISCVFTNHIKGRLLVV